MRRDPLAPLFALDGVSPAVSGARAAVDAVYRLPAVRRRGGGGRVAADAGLRTAVASAALAGARYELAQVRAGFPITDPVVQGALRCAEELPALVDRWPRAPRQVLARLHLLAARGVVEPATLGRPGEDLAAETRERLELLFEVVLRDGEPGLVRAAVVHGELLALRAFPGPYGVVARAAARLELMASGFDPRGLVPVDAGHLAREPEYVGSAGAFATGTPDGVRAWLRHCAAAVRAAASLDATDTPEAGGSGDTGTGRPEG